MDGSGLDRLIDHVLERGVDGIVILGTTGEGFRLDQRTRAAVAERALERIAERAPVALAILRPAPAEVWDELDRAHRLGASAVLVAPPYFGPLDATGVMSFYREVAQRSELPVLVYNIPQYSGIALDPQLVGQLAREGAIQGIKDSSRDMETFCEIVFQVRDLDGFAAFTGTSRLLLSSLAVGAAGAITASANISPEPEAALVRAARTGRWEEARDLHVRVMLLAGALRTGVFPAGIKAALRLLGICSDTPASPTPPLSAAERQALQARLTALGHLSTTGSETPLGFSETGRAQRSASAPRPSGRARR
jgi:4-hydroxy-tetrahydrodipicolinate synthase